MGALAPFTIAERPGESTTGAPVPDAPARQIPHPCPSGPHARLTTHPLPATLPLTKGGDHDKWRGYNPSTHRQTLHTQSRNEKGPSRARMTRLTGPESTTHRPHSAQGLPIGLIQPEHCSSASLSPSTAHQPRSAQAFLFNLAQSSLLGSLGGLENLHAQAIELVRNIDAHGPPIRDLPREEHLREPVADLLLDDST